MKKQYIKLDGLVYKPSGWTEAQMSQFVDGVIELAESFGKGVELACLFKRVAEKELDEQD